MIPSNTVTIAARVVRQLVRDRRTIVIILVVPVVMPLISAVGIDPVHFGVIMTVNLAIGQITPPVGVNLFVASSVSGVPMSRLYRAILPFIAAEALALLLVTFVPAISLALPGWLGMRG